MPSAAAPKRPEDPAPRFSTHDCCCDAVPDGAGQLLPVRLGRSDSPNPNCASGCTAANLQRPKGGSEALRHRSAHLKRGVVLLHALGDVH